MKKHIGKLIISLTTTSYRVTYIQPTLNSLINQNQKADEICLYISKEPYLLDSGIPESDISQIIHKYPQIKVIYTENIGPYRKLLPILKDNWNTNNLIITVDDDTIYPPNFVKRLYKLYCKYKCIIAFRGRKITLNNKNKIKPYNQWIKKMNNNNLDLLNFATGKDGVLYHPSFFTEEIFNKVYLNICPTGDDIWFKFNTYINKIPVLLIHGTFRQTFRKSINIKKTETLFHINKYKNDEQINNVVNYLNILFK